MSSGVFGMLLSHVRGKFRAASGAAGFDFLGFFRGELRNFRDDGFFGFCLFFLFFVEFGAADDGVSFHCVRGFFLLGFDETGGERGDLILVQFNVIPLCFHMVNNWLL